METINVYDDGGVRTIELDRPEALNAFSNLLMDELCDCFLEATDDPGVKVVIVTGAGRAFSAGADLTEMGRGGYTPRHGFAGLLDAIVEFPKPFFVAVNGVGAGIGATICGLADFAFMADGARLRCPFSTLGLTAEAGSTLMFPRLMGRQRASWFLLSAEWMDAGQCLEAGLVMEVTAADELMPRVQQRAQHLASLPLASLQKTKALIVAPFKDQLKAAIVEENQGLAELVGGPANTEALAAFREKRDPDFSAL